MLREVLTGLFADDPTLEPRDVVVACPIRPPWPPTWRPRSPTPGAEPGVGGGSTPAPSCACRSSRPNAAGANQLFALLRDLLTLGATRATASQLLALASRTRSSRAGSASPRRPRPAGRPGGAAAIRWGINPEHRARFGLRDVQQNTWQLGVQRLVLGEAFSDDHLASVGIVATVDDVTSTDTALVGALAELVSRTSRLVRCSRRTARSPSGSTRLRQAVEQLADVPFAEGWQLAQVWAVLESIEARAAAAARPARRRPTRWPCSPTPSPSGASGRRSAAAPSWCARWRRWPASRTASSAWSGSTSAASRGAGSGDGDDLLARDPAPGDPDPGADDRQAVLDAVLAAREHLVVVYQGQSTLTPEPHHPPAGVQELIEAVGGGGGRPARRDAAGVRAGQLRRRARARSTPGRSRAGARPRRAARAPAPDRWAVGHLHRTEPLAELGVDRLAALLQHPGKFLLKERADLTLGDDEPLAESIPLELNATSSRGRSGDAMLGGRCAPATRPTPSPPPQWLSGDLPAAAARGGGHPCHRGEGPQRAPRLPQGRRRPAARCR